MVYNARYLFHCFLINLSLGNILIGELVNEIILKYFINYRCIAFITETDQDILYYVPSGIEIFHIRIEDELGVIENLEENDTLDSAKVSEGTKIFERLLIQTLDAGCQGFIVQVRNFRSIVYSLSRATRRCVTRYDRRYVFLPLNSEYDVNGIFSMKEMLSMPNLIIAKFSNNKDCLFTNRKQFESSIGIHLKTQKEIHFKISNQNYTGQSETLNYNFYVSNNKFNSSNKFNIIDNRGSFRSSNEVCINIITHKFAGNSNSNEEILLDVWGQFGFKNQFLYNRYIFPDKIKNLEGKQLRLIAFPWAQFVVSMQQEDPPIEDGMEVLIFKEFSRCFNSTWKLTLDTKYLWGHISDNGSGTGLLGNVVTDQADFAFAALYVWHSTFQWLDFTRIYSKGAVTCLAPKPKMLPKWMTPIRPFTFSVWMTVFGAMLIVAITFYFFSRLSHFLIGAEGPQRFNNIVESTIYTFGLFLEQTPSGDSVTGTPFHNLFRRFIASVMVFALLLNTAYDSGLSSVLTVPKFEDPIETPEQFAAKNIKWAANHESWTWSIKESDDPVIKAIIKNFKVMDSEKITSDASKEKISFPIEMTSGGYYAVGLNLTTEILRNLRIMKEPLYWSPIVALSRKNSAYLEHLNTLISRLLSGGIIFYWEGETIRKYYSLTLQTAIARSADLVKDDGPIKLTVGHIEGTFFILFIGLFISFVAFVFELILNLFKKPVSSTVTYYIKGPIR
ncbi:Ionotropic receptor 41a2 [Blattella germanica]|nr:Ionotropic receptor 41a2 [Blattella germanica]